MSLHEQYKHIRDLPGLGPKSEAQLKTIGIQSLKAFVVADPYELYGELKLHYPDISLNFLYAMIGAQELTDWKQIAQTRKMEILLRLDDLGLAP